MSVDEPIGTAVVGYGFAGRCFHSYLVGLAAPALKLHGVVSSRAEARQDITSRLGVRAYSSFDEVLADDEVELVVLATPNDVHAPQAIAALQAGKHVVTDKPMSLNLGEADEMIAAAKQFGTKIEVAENYYRVPSERIKRAMILEGIFGEIHTAYNDFRGHGYHGVGLIRSYIGLDVGVRRAFGFTRKRDVQEHTFRGNNPTSEQWQHGVIEFDNDSVGIYNFSSLSYGSPLRRYNTSKFFGERGLCIGDEPAILDEAAEERRPITIERQTHTVDGREVLAALVADTPTPVTWENPHRHYPLSDGQIAVASELMSIADAVRNDTEPEYGYMNGRIDREVDLAMSRSWANGGAPVDLPL